MNATDKIGVLAMVDTATHRYPPEVLWGSDYANGWRYIIAGDDDDAIRQALSRCPSITRKNIQRRTVDGWEFIA